MLLIPYLSIDSSLMLISTKLFSFLKKKERKNQGDGEALSEWYGSLFTFNHGIKTGNCDFFLSHNSYFFLQNCEFMSTLRKKVRIAEYSLRPKLSNSDFFPRNSELYITIPREKSQNCEI